MIDDQRTLEIYGYTSEELSKGSHKPIVTVCDECGKYRISENKAYRLICKSCAGRKRVMTEENKEKMRLSKIGSNNPNYGKKDSKETRKRKTRVLLGNSRSKGCTQNLSPEVRLIRSVSMIGNKYNEGKKASGTTKEKMSDSAMGHAVSDETKRKISANHARYWVGKSPSEETKRKLSASGQGIPLSEWQGYVTENPYCEKFNESCRERNREKYMRTCFICGKDEVLNGQKLSVHHVDRNKDQGCNDHDWSLVPLCKKHHGSCHNDLWESRIMYLLNHVWRTDT